MRQFLPFVIVLIGGPLFTACSKKADTSPGTSSSPSDAPATATGNVIPTEEDSGISFSLSGSGEASGQSTASTTTGASGTAAKPGMEPAQLLNRVYPFYPLSLRMRGIEGRVDIRVHLDATGKIERTEVVQATEPRLSEFAVAAVRTARFVPARENGKPVAIQYVVSIPFVSEMGSGSLPPGSPLGYLAYLDGLYYMKDANGKMIPADRQVPERLTIIAPYPASAKPGELLKAKVKVAITDEGQVTSVTVADASSADFAAAIKEVAPFWQFIPRMKNGKPMPSAAVEFPFNVNMPAQP